MYPRINMNFWFELQPALLPEQTILYIKNTNHLVNTKPLFSVSFNSNLLIYYITVFQLFSIKHIFQNKGYNTKLYHLIYKLFNQATLTYVGS